MNKLALISLIVLSSTLSASALPNIFNLKALQDKIPQLSAVGSSFWVGRCPQTTEIKGGFNLTQYLGKWYEIKRTGLVFEFGQRCVKAEYKLDSDGNVAVNNSGVNLVNFEIYSLGTAKPGTQSNVFAVTFFPLSPAAQYWVVDTDYETYSLVVSCNDVLGLFNVKDAWILSRKPKLDEDIVNRLVGKLDTLGIPSFLLSSTTQNCEN
ncbi:apolipoprotein D isoform X1 [Tetranychus urticae]|uniref:Apolipoprotein D n=1 Tax=Tetranychus urticae TaxID=32264 RepID=T1JR60_TETUR|nr:apolipoprotein D isoform X1 [Tetranychus urticae]